MATEKEILDDQAFVTDRISAQVRAIALSMIAVCWLFLSGAANLERLAKSGPEKVLLLVCIVLAFVALVLDYFQYVAGYFSTKQTHNKGPNTQGAYLYDYHSAAYVTRSYMFVGKQIVIVAAVVMFLIAMVRPLF